MGAADQKLHRELLIQLYEEVSPHFRRRINTSPLVQEFDMLDRDELRYHINRLEEHRFVERKGRAFAEITVEGVEKLDRDGYNTFLESDLRYEILRVAYDIDRGKSAAYINVDDFTEALEVSEEDLTPHTWYLSGKHLLGPVGGRTFQLTADGRNRYEEYRNEGLPVPRTHPTKQFTQHTIGQGDQEKAENIFREIVELAREEVLVIDTFAKGRLFQMLEEHVPSIVDVKILMSDREVEEENIDLYHNFAEGKDGKVELRYLDYRTEYPFHQREVIRDREQGWIWDHTFADAGKKHHTISQLRPVNLETDLEAFEEAWAEAEMVE